MMRTTVARAEGKQSLLSIAIPTFRRPHLLRKCLESIVTASRERRCNISVHDDSVSDINTETLDWLQSVHSDVSIYRNVTNLGIDANIRQCLSRSKAKYTWLLGEDDLLCANAIAEVASALERRDYPFVFVNYSYISNDYSRITRQRRIDLEAFPDMDGNVFFSKYMWATGFIGSCIVNSGEWLRRDSAKYLGTYFNHVGVIAEMIHGRRVGLIASPLVLNRAEDIASTSWSEMSFDVNFGWDEMLYRLRDVYEIPLLNEAQASSRQLFWDGAFIFFVSKRADGMFNLKAWKRYVWRNGFGFAFSVSALLLLVVPRPPLLWCKWIYRKVRSLRQ